MNFFTASRSIISVVFILLFTGFGFSNEADAKSPWQVHWVGEKPDLDGRMLRVSHFSLRKNAVPQMEYRVLLPMLQAFADGQREEAKYIALEATWGQFNEVFGVAANASTFVEHAMFASGLAGINGFFTKAGTALGALQVVLDISANNHRAALVNSYKTVQGYWLGTVGTAGMQIGGVAAFVVDYWLTDIRETTWKNHKDKLRIAYVNYYKNSGNKGYRDINEWKILIHKIYDDSRKKSRRLFASSTKAKEMQSAYFSYHLDKLIDAHTDVFWHDPLAAAEISDSEHLKLFRGESNADRAALRNEYRTNLIRQFTRRIFPELTHRTWKKWAQNKLKSDMNGTGSYTLVSKLNKVFVLEVHAYGLEQPARLLIHRPSGKPWKGSIRPGRKVGVKMTKVAFIRAGLPNKISMIIGNKTTTLPFYFGKDDRAIVSFGVPKTMAVVTYDRQESSQTCNGVRHRLGKKSEKFTETRNAASGPIHMTSSPQGETIIGRYSLDENKWLEHSVGKNSLVQLSANNLSAMDIAGKMKVEYSVKFSPPYFNNIVALDKCKGQVTLIGRSKLACTVRRYERKQVSNNTLIERHCTSTITLKSKNMFMTTGSMKGQIVDFESKAMKQNEREISRGVQEMKNLLKNLPKQ